MGAEESAGPASCTVKVEDDKPELAGEQTTEASESQDNYYIALPTLRDMVVEGCVPRRRLPSVDVQLCGTGYLPLLQSPLGSWCWGLLTAAAMPVDTEAHEPRPVGILKDPHSLSPSTVLHTTPGHRNKVRRII